MLRNWLRSVLELSHMLGLSLSDLFDLLSRILQVGCPPPIADEPALRGWVRTVGEIAVDAAKLTEISADDQLAAFCLKCVGSDDVWGIAYSMIQMVAADNPPLDGDLEWLSHTMPPEAGVNPAVVLALVQLCHTWPGTKPVVSISGKSTMDISANDLIWDFFQRHALE